MELDYFGMNTRVIESESLKLLNVGKQSRWMVFNDWGTTEGLNWRLMVELETTKQQIHLAGSVGKSNLIPSLLAASPPTMASSRPAEFIIDILILSPLSGKYIKSPLGLNLCKMGQQSLQVLLKLQPIRCLKTKNLAKLVAQLHNGPLEG